MNKLEKSCIRKMLIPQSLSYFEKFCMRSLLSRIASSGRIRDDGDSRTAGMKHSLVVLIFTWGFDEAFPGGWGSSDGCGG